jgi:ankyrin repeat protein
MQDEVQLFYQESLKEQKSSTENLNLVRAVYNGNNSVVKLLLEKEADIAEKIDTRQTALHIAAMKGTRN